jgi:hypothetical protein
LREPPLTQDTMTTDPSLLSAFAPHGTLRASINLGNPILANKDPATGEPVGVSIDLARELGQRLRLLDHFGLLGFEVRPATWLRILGAGLSVIGVVLIAVF